MKIRLTLVAAKKEWGWWCHIVLWFLCFQGATHKLGEIAWLERELAAVELKDGMEDVRIVNRRPLEETFELKLHSSCDLNEKQSSGVAEDEPRATGSHGKSGGPTESAMHIALPLRVVVSLVQVTQYPFAVGYRSSLKVEQQCAFPIVRHQEILEYRSTPVYGLPTEPSVHLKRNLKVGGKQGLTILRKQRKSDPQRENDMLRAGKALAASALPEKFYGTG